MLHNPLWKATSIFFLLCVSCCQLQGEICCEWTVPFIMLVSAKFQAAIGCFSFVLSLHLGFHYFFLSPIAYTILCKMLSLEWTQRIWQYELSTTHDWISQHLHDKSSINSLPRLFLLIAFGKLEHLKCIVFLFILLQKHSLRFICLLLSDSNTNVNMINRRMSLFYRYPLEASHHMVCVGNTRR